MTFNYLFAHDSTTSSKLFSQEINNGHLNIKRSLALPGRLDVVDGLDDVVMVSVEMTSGGVFDVAIVVVNSGVVGVLEGFVVAEVDLSVMSTNKVK